MVFAFLRERLLEGSLAPGDWLIPERELAPQLGVSRPVLREALRALAVLGVVEIRGRDGTLVCQADLSILNDFFTFAFLQRSELIDDVMEARTAIECQAIRLAAERATVADLEDLRRAMEKIVSTIDDPDAGGLADFEFHKVLVRASKSEMLTVLHDSMSSILRRSHRERRLTLASLEAGGSDVIEDHRRLVDAVASRNVDGAEKALRRHFAIGDEVRHRVAISERRPARPANARGS